MEEEENELILSVIEARKSTPFKTYSIEETKKKLSAE